MFESSACKCNGNQPLQVGGQKAPDSQMLVILTKLQMEESTARAELVQRVQREVGRYSLDAPKPRPLFQAMAHLSQAEALQEKSQASNTGSILNNATLEMERCCAALASSAAMPNEAGILGISCDVCCFEQLFFCFLLERHVVCR